MEKTAVKNSAAGKNIRLYYGILLGVMSVVCGALFITAVWTVYLSGNGFSRERLVESINTFALVPFIIWVVMVVIGFVLWEVFPPESRRYKNDVRYNLYRQKKRLPESVSEPLKASYKAFRREEKIVKILWIVAAVICLAAAIYTVVYLCLPSSFPSVENKSIPVFTMVKRVLPVIVAAFAVCCGVAIYEGKSAKKQLEEVKKLTVGEKVKIKPNLWTKWREKAVAKKEKELSKVSYWTKRKEKIALKATKKVYARHVKFLESMEKSRLVNCRRFYTGLVKFMDFTGKHYIAIIRAAVACVCVAFVIAGIFNEGAYQMLQKAIIICTECIGLG